MFRQIDTYGKVATAKLYDGQNALTAAVTLNDVVLPFFEEKELPLLRIFTVRGTEYCGWEVLLWKNTHANIHRQQTCGQKENDR